jgi:hypothetical protein
VSTLEAARLDDWVHESYDPYGVGAYRAAKFQTFGQTAESMGRENPDMLYKNYREVIKEQGTLMSSANWFRPKAGRVSLPSMLPFKSGWKWIVGGIFTRHFSHLKTNEAPKDRALLLTAILAA